MLYNSTHLNIETESEYVITIDTTTYQHMLSTYNYEEVLHITVNTTESESLQSVFGYIKLYLLEDGQYLYSYYIKPTNTHIIRLTDSWELLHLELDITLLAKKLCQEYRHIPTELSYPIIHIQTNSLFEQVSINRKSIKLYKTTTDALVDVI